MYIEPPPKPLKAAPKEATPAPLEYPILYDTIDELVEIYKASNIRNRMDFQPGYLNISCGITSLYSVRGCLPSQIVRKILVERSSWDYKKIREAFVQWSDTDNNSKTGGNALYKYIVDNNLGKVVEFGPRMNPNTGNMIKMWVWEPPHESLHQRDRLMPVRGHRRVFDNGSSSHHDGSHYERVNPEFSEVSEDTRFLEDRFERGTTKA